jgi:hypothetical protein
MPPGHTPSYGISGSSGDSVLSSEESPALSMMATPFTSPLTIYNGSSFSTASPTLIITAFNYSHASGPEKC